MGYHKPDTFASCDVCGELLAEEADIEIPDEDDAPAIPVGWAEVEIRRVKLDPDTEKLVQAQLGAFLEAVKEAKNEVTPEMRQTVEQNIRKQMPAHSLHTWVALLCPPCFNSSLGGMFERFDSEEGEA